MKNLIILNLMILFLTIPMAGNTQTLGTVRTIVLKEKCNCNQFKNNTPLFQSLPKDSGERYVMQSNRVFRTNGVFARQQTLKSYNFRPIRLRKFE